MGKSLRDPAEIKLHRARSIKFFRDREERNGLRCHPYVLRGRHENGKQNPSIQQLLVLESSSIHSSVLM
ncbi:uncharacterized [Tachysurus ichikawai]